MIHLFGRFRRPSYHREKFLSPWADDLLSAIGTLIFIAAIGALCVEFPNGLAQLRDLHVALIHQ